MRRDLTSPVFFFYYAVVAVIPSWVMRRDMASPVACGVLCVCVCVCVCDVDEWCVCVRESLDKRECAAIRRRRHVCVCVCEFVYVCEW